MTPAKIEEMERKIASLEREVSSLQGGILFTFFLLAGVILFLARYWPK